MRFGRWAVGLLTVSLVASACTAGTGHVSGGPDPTGTTTFTGSPASLPPTSPAEPSEGSSPTAGATAPRFRRVAEIEGTELHAAITFDGGYVVAGCRFDAAQTRCLGPRILVSSDGMTWVDATIPDAGTVSIEGLASTPLGLLAFGSDAPSEPPARRSLWRSDDGTTWEAYEMPAPDAIVFSDALVLDGTTVLIGADSSYDLAVETEAWATTDGARWARGKAPMSPKVAVAGGALAIGDDCVDTCPDGLPIMVHRSNDGLSWSDGRPEPAFTGARIGPVEEWAGRAVVGGEIAGEPAIWIGEAGRWRILRIDAPVPSSVTTLLPTEERLIGLVDDGGGSTAGWTRDGTSWDEAPLGFEGSWISAWAAGDRPIAIANYSVIWRAQ